MTDTISDTTSTATLSVPTQLDTPGHAAATLSEAVVSRHGQSGKQVDEQSRRLLVKLRHLLMRCGEWMFFLALGAVTVEMLFRFCGIGQQEYLQSDPVLGCRHIPGQLVTWRLEGYSSDHLSSAGLRDIEHSIAKANGVTRVALLGDSSTEGLQVPMEDTYTRVLERKLNNQADYRRGKVSSVHDANGRSLLGHSPYEVINFACSSYSTGQEYVQFKKQVTAYRPDITVLLYNCGDSLENVRDPKKADVEPRPYFYLDRAGHLQEDDLILKKISNGHGDSPIVEFLQRNSRIYSVFKQLDLMLSINEKLYRKLRSAALHMFAASTGASNNAQQYIGSYARSDGLQVSEALLLALDQACKKNHSKFILLLFPNTNNNQQYVCEQRQLQSFAQQHSLQMLDLTKSFLTAPNSSELFLQYHFSKYGHELVADQLASIITKH